MEKKRDDEPKFTSDISERAQREIRKLSDDVEDRVIQGCERLKSDPFPDGNNIKKLKKFKDLYRLRIGDYWVVFRIRDRLVEIVDVLKKSDFEKKY